MRTLFILCFFIFQSFLYAINIEMYIGPGYRRDEFTFTIYNPNNAGAIDLKQEFQMGHSAQEALFINFIWDQVRWEFSGDFGWLVEGEGKISSSLQGISTTFNVKNFYGYEADGYTELGYDIPVYKRRYFHLEFTPLFGVYYRHLASRVKGRLYSNISNILGFTGSMDYEETRLNHADIWGPFFEARLGLLFTRMFDMKLFYQYHFLFYRHVIEPTIDTVQQPVAINLTLTDDHFVLASNNAGSHVGGFDVNVTTLNDVIMGLRGYGSVVFTRDGTYKVRSITTTSPPDAVTVAHSTGKAKFHWTIYSVVGYFGYRF